MRITIFTFILSVLSLGLFAQDMQTINEWNISSDDFNSLGVFNEVTTVDGLTMYASADKALEVDGNNKSVDDMSFTHRLKLGGAGSVTDGVASERVVSFDVDGDISITVAAMSSGSSEDRELVIQTAEGDTLAVFPALGESLTMADYEYTGEATTIFMYSKSSGINIYYIKTSVEVEEPAIVDSYAVFDPATVDPELLADGMSIVELEGKKYLQVVVDGWDSTIDIPEFTIEEGMVAYTEMKYALGEGSEFALNQINCAVQFMDTVNVVENPWGEGMIPSSSSIGQSPATGEWSKVSGGFSSDMQIIHQLQLFGQETQNWGAVAGDTLWVGKIRAYYNAPNVIADPVTYDPAALNDNWEIVDIDGVKYFKVHLQSWGNELMVNEYSIPEGHTQFSADIKYEVVESGYELSQINTFFKLANIVGEDWTEIGAAGSGSSAEFNKYSVNIAEPELTVSAVQVAGQETVSWGAVTGDYMYIGKVTTNFPPDPYAIADPATIDPGMLNEGWEIVDIEGTKYFKVAINGWESWTNIPEFEFPEGTNAFMAMVKYEQGESEYAVENVNTFLKLSTPGWGGIAEAGSASSTEFKPYVISVDDPTLNAGVFQVAAQETTGWSATVGCFLYIGKVTAVTQTPVTFVVDDSADKTNEGFMLKGSWYSGSGVYDVDWSGGVEHTAFAEDEEGSGIWSVTLTMVADGGENTWEWGFNNLEGTWIPTANIQFTVEDETPVTTTYVIEGESSVDQLNKNITVYPNPTSGRLTIRGAEVRSIEVYNLSGSKVQVSASGNSADVSHLANGAYIMKAVDTNGNILVGKFNKN